MADEPPASALGPPDIQDAYNLPAGRGSGQTVAIVDAFGYSKAEDDLAAFRDYYGLPPCTTANGCFRKVDQRGGTDYPPDNAGWALETALDLDAVSSACPTCHILLVEGDSNSVADLSSAVDEAVSLGAKYVSNSYGASDSVGDPGGFDTHYDHPGVAIVASSGDVGNVVIWPSSIPTVTSAGGTSLTRETSATRGWTETAWARGGSGCSSVEPKPDYQDGSDGLDAVCPDNRATADIAADADPNTGLGVYDTLGQGGWLQVGGTSLSSPLLAAMYALAGTPVPGSYPVTYPYKDLARSGDLNDITDGVNGSCGNLLCQAGPGWDGPTGWGTPNGVAALRGGPQGDITGTVTNSATGDPIAHATVSTPGGYTVTTQDDGTYDLYVPVGSYDVTAQIFGYAAKTQSGVQVSEDQTTTIDFALDKVPNSTVSGTVTDASGHGWPVHAKITVEGDPRGPIYADPYTGRYSVDLPQQNTYMLHVQPLYPGYQAKDMAVQVDTSDVSQDIALVVDPTACIAPGYAPRSGVETFTGWRGTTPHDGWAVTDNSGNGNTWTFDDLRRYPTPGGDHDFAIIDATYNHDVGSPGDDTSLVSPAVDLAGVAEPVITFDTNYSAAPDESAHVDLSLDDGNSWHTVWSRGSADEHGRVEIPIPHAAGKTAVRVRFHHLVDSDGSLISGSWGVDDVVIGDDTCTPVAGGFVAGVVRDANTGDTIDHATVASKAKPDESTIASATGDPNLPGAFYALFSSHTGATPISVSRSGYQTATTPVDVDADTVVRQDWQLNAGRLSVATDKLSLAETLGQATTREVTFTNSGSGPLHVDLGVQDRGATATDHQIHLDSVTRPTRATAGKEQAGKAPASKWTKIAPYPIGVSSPAVATDPVSGKVYSVGGSVFYSPGSIAITTAYPVTHSSYVYDPSRNEWSPIADAPKPLTAARAAFLDGTLYLVGGASGDQRNLRASDAVYAYDPGADRWSTVASLPRPLGLAGTAVLDGQLYVVGGCTALSTVSTCSLSSTPALSSAYRFDPHSGTWTQLADYPTPVNAEACAGVHGEVVCAGGAQPQLVLDDTYLYDPATDTWSRGADMPVATSHMAYAGADGKLEIAGGFAPSTPIETFTAGAWQYDPVADRWSALPDVTSVADYAGGACGFYKVGGRTRTRTTLTTLRRDAELLSGYDRCGGAGDTAWLATSKSSIDLAPGQSRTVSVTLDSAQVDQPGTYTATLYPEANSPYPVPTVDVSMRVNPPRGWALVEGTVTDADGHPLHLATVTDPGRQHPFAVRTNAEGRYHWWMTAKPARVRLSAAKDGYQPQATTVALKPGGSMSVDFTLQGDPGASADRPASGKTTSTTPAPRDPTPAGTTAKRPTGAGGQLWSPACDQPAKPGRATCLALPLTGLPGHKGVLPQGTPAGYGPGDLQDAYNLPSATAGEGETVAIVDAYDDPTAEQDLAVYREQYGLPPCTTENGCFQKVNQRGEQGDYPPANAGWAVEISLDIDMVSAACPNCHILLVEGDTPSLDDLGTAVNTAVELGAKYVSNSYGARNGDGSEADLTAYDHYYDHPGVAVTASAGDWGYGVLWPASNPTVTSVGGTSLIRDSGTTRGWTESVWGNGTSGGKGAGTGSGCSKYETKPVWQHDTGCAHRTVADVSAVADPNTGVAVYDTTGSGGWLVVGGTSASSPIVASTFALAGTPRADTYPASYPYLHSGGLNDVTTGSNGSCTPAYLCTGGDGYDGPTGLGTPDGTSAFTPASAGKVEGTVTDAATGKPIPSAKVSVGDVTTRTDKDGGYSAVVAPGSYTVIAQVYGYAAKKVTDVEVTDGQTTTQDFTLTPSPQVTLSGTVTDGSGHGWPLHAKITIGGVPGAPTTPVYTNPYTGKYSLSIPGDATYTLHVESAAPGYGAKDVPLDIGTSDAHQDVALNVQVSPCLAPGYAGGVYEQFEWGLGETGQDGWTVDRSTSVGWIFRTGPPNPGGVTTGGYALATYLLPQNGSFDASLISPTVDLSHSTAPEISLDNAYYNFSGNSLIADVDLSLDGGKTWQNVSRQDEQRALHPAHLTIPMPQAAGKSDVKVRFHIVGKGHLATWWIDNVEIGGTCDPVPGGLLAGVVTDTNTGDPVDDATVAGSAESSQPGTSAAPDDPNLPDGFYTAFSSHTGSTAFTATAPGYAETTEQSQVTKNAVVHHDWALKAGRLALNPAGASATATLGQSTTATVTVTNTGNAPMHVDLGTQDGTVTALGREDSAADHEAAGAGVGVARDAALAAQRSTALESGHGWAKIAPYPLPMAHNAVAYDAHTGDVYSVGGTSKQDNVGFNGVSEYYMTAKAFVYHPGSDSWAPIAPAPQPLAFAQAAFVAGTLYVVGGLGAGAQPVSTVYAYHPTTNTWASVASLPEPRWAGAQAVLAGKLYIIGGFDAGSGATSSVYRYDPIQGSWTRLADYPTTVNQEACGGIAATVVCAGGRSDTWSAQGNGMYAPIDGLGNGQLAQTYIYDPMTDTWSRGADMPHAAFAMGYGAANGRLQVFGGLRFGGGLVGVAVHFLSDAAEYDPATNTWSALPSLPVPTAFAGASCGLFLVSGHHDIDNDMYYGPTADALTLSGYGQCEGQGGPAWLSTKNAVELAPGESVDLVVKLDAAQVAQPGTYTATVWARPYSPYPVKPVTVTMRVKPPVTWGLLTGNVTDAGTGDPIGNATVQLCARFNRHRGTCRGPAFTVKTDVHGDYQWWVDTRHSPLDVLVARDHFVQQETSTTIRRGGTRTLDIALPAYQE